MTSPRRLNINKCWMEIDLHKNIQIQIYSNQWLWYNKMVIVHHTQNFHSWMFPLNYIFLLVLSKWQSMNYAGTLGKKMPSGNQQSKDQQTYKKLGLPKTKSALKPLLWDNIWSFNFKNRTSAEFYNLCDRGLGSLLWCCNKEML